MLNTLRRLEQGGSTTVIGETASFSPTAAALLNGAMAHSLDFDDTHAAGSIHSSAPIVPAALAAAQMAGANGKELIAAIVAGYEVQIRLSLALVPKDHYDRGFHPTATCGTSRRGRSRGTRDGSGCGCHRQRVWNLRLTGGRVHAIPGRWRLEQALPRG